MRPPPSRPHEVPAAPYTDPVKVALRRRSGSRRRGRCGCSVGPSGGSILRRRLAMWARRTWRSSSYSTPQTSTRRARWVISRPRLRASTRSSSNSVGVRWTGSPSRRTLRAARSISRPSATIVGSAASGAGAAQRRLQPRDQLARAERLGHVVVGAGRQRLDLAVLLADRGEDEDRHLAPLAQPPRHLDPVDVGQHQVEDRRLAAGAPRRGRAPPPRCSPAPPRSRRRAGSPSAPAGSAARRRRRGCGAASLTPPPPLGSGEGDDEAAALARQRLDRDLAAVGLDEAPGDRQAEAGARCAAALRAR